MPMFAVMPRTFASRNRLAYVVLSGVISCGCGPDPEYVLGRFEPRAVTSPPDGGGPPSSPDARSDAGGCDPGVPRADFVFTGAGDVLVDARGGPSGSLRGGAVLDGSGELVLDGDDDYVDLPNGLISGLQAATVVVWLRHLGGPAYTRLFDLGSGSDGEDPAEGLGTVGRTYLAVTPSTGFVPGQLAALISGDGSGGEIGAVTDVRLDDALHLVAVAVTSTTLELFHDGLLIARVPNPVQLESIEAVNNWLGRSQYDQDPYLYGAYQGFAVFDHALESCAIRELYAEGP